MNPSHPYRGTIEAKPKNNVCRLITRIACAAFALSNVAGITAVRIIGIDNLDARGWDAYPILNIPASVVFASMLWFLVRGLFLLIEEIE